MDWRRVLVPLSGGESDGRTLAAAAAVAAPFKAELSAAHAPADIADLIPWMGDGFMGGVQAAALDSIRRAGSEGEQAARTAVETCGYARATFTALKSPVGTALAMEGRLSDVVVFDDAAARGRGPLGEAFRQILASEQRPVIVARPGLRLDGVAALAGDGGKEASRAMRTALPLLQRASKVVVVTAPGSSSRKFDLDALKRFLAARGIACEVDCLTTTGDPAPPILGAVRHAGADILIAGAFGHPRLQEYIFGGTTRGFLNADGPSLFLSH
ncbi:MAG: universal stress protein [Caulobacteraceae bacterium]